MHLCLALELDVASRTICRGSYLACATHGPVPAFGPDAAVGASARRRAKLWVSVCAAFSVVLLTLAVSEPAHTCSRWCSSSSCRERVRRVAFSDVKREAITDVRLETVAA